MADRRQGIKPSIVEDLFVIIGGREHVRGHVFGHGRSKPTILGGWMGRAEQAHGGWSKGAKMVDVQHRRAGAWTRA
jgi:hypothetical protein